MAEIILKISDDTKAKVVAEITKRKKSGKLNPDASLSSIIRDHLNDWLKKGV